MRRFSPVYSIELDGTADYLTCGTGFNFTDGSGTDQAFSISGWIYFKDATSRGILSKRSVWELALNPSDQLVCNLYTSGVIYIGRTTAALTSLEHTWVHVAMTYSGGETNSSVKLYVNGAQADTADSSAGSYTGMPSNSTTVTMGALDSSLRWFGGYMGGLRVWSKELSLAEVKEDMVIEDHNFHSAKSSIRNWWAPETFDGTTLQDRKGGVNATAVSMAASSRVTGGTYPYRWQTRGDGETPHARFGGMAWDFDGTNEYIEIADSASLSFGNGTTDSAFSISGWAFMDDASSFTIFSKDNASTQREYLFYLGGDDKLIVYLFDQSATANITRSYNTALTSYQGQWVHFGMSYDGSSTAAGIKLYLNGVRVDDTSSGTGSYTAMEAGTYQAFIGRVWSTYSNGKIADVILYNKELTATEVSQIYNAGLPRNELNTNISNKVSYWRPYDSSNGSNNVLDLVGSNPGTLTNTETTDTAGADRNYPVKIYDNTNKASYSTDGSNEYARITGYSLNGFTVATMNFWFKKGNTGGYIIAMPEVSGGTNGIDFYISSTNLWGYVKTTGAASLLQNVVAGDSKWHMVTLVYNGANFTSYIDGKSPYSVAKTGTISLTANEINVGRFGTFGSYSSQNFCHLSIWNTALSLIEIGELYNNGTPSDLSKHSKYANAVNWWKFDANDSATGTITDVIGSQNMTCFNGEAGDIQTNDYPS